VTNHCHKNLSWILVSESPSPLSESKGALDKRWTPGLEQAKYRMSLESFVVPEVKLWVINP
jgi:hypothetical protein